MDFSIYRLPGIGGESRVWFGPGEHKLVGDCLETVRLSAGITQRELALKLGKPQSFVSAYESGQRRVDILEFLTIVGAIGGDAQKVLTKIKKSTLPIVKKALQRKL